MKICIPGGAGYVGSRVAVDLRRRGHEVVVVDAGILSDDPDLSQDLRQMDPVPADVTIWMASIHDVPPHLANTWRAVADNIMVTAPRRWAALTDGRFIYLSSTRAGTHPRTLYGEKKCLFEQYASYSKHVTVVRPGTVWGDLRPGWVNRTHTVINRLAIQPDWSPEWTNEPFFTCRMDKLVRAIRELVEEPQHRMSGLVWPVTDTPRPVRGTDLRDGWRPVGFRAAVWPIEEKPPLGEHPMVKYAGYYGLPWTS